MALHCTPHSSTVNGRRGVFRPISTIKAQLRIGGAKWGASARDLGAAPRGPRGRPGIGRAEAPRSPGMAGRPPGGAPEWRGNRPAPACGGRKWRTGRIPGPASRKPVPPVVTSRKPVPPVVKGACGTDHAINMRDRSRNKRVLPGHVPVASTACSPDRDGLLSGPAKRRASAEVGRTVVMKQHAAWGCCAAGGRCGVRPSRRPGGSGDGARPSQRAR